LQKKSEFKVLHLGELEFPLPWEAWYSLVKEKLGVTFHRQLCIEEQSIQDLDFLQYDFIRIAPGFTRTVAGLFDVASPLINRLHYTDFLLKKGGVHWPHTLIKDAVHSLIIEAQPFSNTKGAALIVGSSSEAILTAHSLIELGLKHISFVVKNDHERQALLETMGHLVFDIKIEAFKVDQVVLLTGIYSLLICFEDLRKNSELLTALLYFNYLLRGGLVINAGFPIDNTALLEEAAAIRARVIDRSDIQLHLEISALRKVLPISQTQFSQLRSPLFK
jgi:hypothetical protein